MGQTGQVARHRAQFGANKEPSGILAESGFGGVGGPRGGRPGGSLGSVWGSFGRVGGPFGKLSASWLQNKSSRLQIGYFVKPNGLQIGSPNFVGILTKFGGLQRDDLAAKLE